MQQSSQFIHNVPPPPHNPQNSGGNTILPYTKGDKCRLLYEEMGILDVAWIVDNANEVDVTALQTNSNARRRPFHQGHTVTVQEVLSRKVDDNKTSPPLEREHALYTVTAKTSIPVYLFQPGQYTIPYRNIIKADGDRDLEIGHHCYLASDYTDVQQNTTLLQNTMFKVQDIKRKTSLSFDRILSKSTSNDARISEVVVRVVTRDTKRVQYRIERRLVNTEVG